MWMSKIRGYENPYSVKGTIKSTGSNWEPKGICKDSNNGTREAHGGFTTYEVVIRKS